MNAVFFHKHGGPEVLEYGEFETPQPGPGEVQIRLKAAAINRADIWVRNGWSKLKLTFPHIPGADGAGDVSSIGTDVKHTEVGDRAVVNPSVVCGQCSLCRSGKDNLCRDWHLLGETIPGTYAEYLVVPERNVLHIPDGFEYRTAAAASLVFITAWHSLVTRGSLKPGESVLIVGASGGVNMASIQVAKYVGAEVFVVGSNEEKLIIAQSIGADVLIDRATDTDWAKTAYQMTGREGVDVVVDNVGAGTMPLSMRAARKGGRILTVGNTAGPKFEIDNRYIFGKHLSILGSTMGTTDDFHHVMDLVFKGQLRPVLDQNYSLQDANQAHMRLESGEQMGKITLEI
ncbi:MAG: zinc-binding dehydrogenase [Anaerolineales bacterium]|nr:zinc-binding dehydrogenase [Anaerolineales bacterium]